MVQVTVFPLLPLLSQIPLHHLDGGRRKGSVWIARVALEWGSPRQSKKEEIMEREGSDYVKEKEEANP